MDRPGAHGVNSLSGLRGYGTHKSRSLAWYCVTLLGDRINFASWFESLEMPRSRSGMFALSVQEVYLVRAGVGLTIGSADRDSTSSAQCVDNFVLWRQSITDDSRRAGEQRAVRNLFCWYGG